MAANKFATMLHRNTHRITAVLVYTVLEWTLIVLLLLNSIFSYLIVKFAAFFGLKPPCPWCSSLDHILEPENNPISYRNLLCETHANEISRLGYCSNHRKFAESGQLCKDCSSLRPTPTALDQRVSLFSLIGSDQVPKCENGVKDMNCSCCGAIVNAGFFSPYLIFKPSWGVLDYTQKGNLIKEKDEEAEDCCGFTENGYSDPSKSDFLSDHDEDGVGNRGEVAENQILSDVLADKFRGIEMGDCLTCEIGSAESEQDSVPPSIDDNVSPFVFHREEDESFKIATGYCEKCSEDDRRVPIELIDSVTLENQYSSQCGESDGLLLDEEVQKHDKSAIDAGIMLNEKTIPDQIEAIGDDIGSGTIETVSEKSCPAVFLDEIKDNTGSGKIETICESRCPLVFLDEDSDGDLVAEVGDQVAVTQAIPVVSPGREKAVAEICDQVTMTQPINMGSEVREKIDGDKIELDENDFSKYPALEEDIEKIDTELKSESIIERDISHEESMGPQIDELVTSSTCQNDSCSENYDRSSSSTPCDGIIADEDKGPDKANELVTDSRDCCLVSNNPIIEVESAERNNNDINHHLSTLSELNDAEEDRMPETPTYMEGINNLHKRLLFERKESGTESLDGSVMSEFEGGEGLTIDRLKSALRAERKALNALYAELEEERSASAIAANQTMAMITRLQEEKAAMQMEALQYQRMMEEQSEYDQEALQLLNELMVKREKEKQELEKELDLYHKKVLRYEAKEKRIVKNSKKANMSDAISSTSTSSEDIDSLSVDLNEGEDSFYGMHESNHHTPADEVLSFGNGPESAKQIITLDESLANFEEERLSILEQLKGLEEKLIMLGGEDETFEDMKSIEHLSQENRHMLSERFELECQDMTVVTNGSSDELGMDGKHHNEYRNVGSKAKRLLPLFDATSMENDNELNDEIVSAISSLDSISKSASKKKLAIEEEVDHVHERLHALEADGEFLRHCVGSIRKGDRGIELLQEILQHLRDLRSVDLRVRNSHDSLS